MKRSKKILSALLAVIMVIPFAVSCSKPAADSNTSNTSTSDSSKPTEGSSESGAPTGERTKISWAMWVSSSVEEDNGAEERLTNAVFELGLHVYELAIYAYLLRIEDRRTWQCVVSYPAVADKLGISVNTVAKYVGLLEEHGLITTERTDVFTKDGLKRNGCLRYTILPIQNAIDRFHERQLAELEQAAAQQRARRQAEKSGVAFIQANREQSA